MLSQFSLSPCATDIVEWLLDVAFGYKVSNDYGLLAEGSYSFSLSSFSDKASGLIWRICIPFRIKAFGWRVLLNRILSKDQLSHRGIISNYYDIVCVLCIEVEESTFHLFLGCDFALKVWREVSSYIGMEVCPVNSNIIDSFLLWLELFNKKKLKKGKEGLMWITLVWS